MKHFIILAALFFTIQMSHAQQQEAVRANNILPDFTLDITWNKTTMLRFPAPIRDADRGDSYILAERMEGVENVLKVKAGKKDFPPSNLHVVTTDGKLYAFTVNYAENPSTFTIDIGAEPPYTPTTFEGISLNSEELEFAAAGIMEADQFIRGVKQRKYGMELKLEGIFVKEDVILFRYNLKNSTQIRYGAAAPRFYIRDKKKAKRTTVQDTEMEPVFVQHSGVPENSDGQIIILAFPKFTIAESKYFVTEIMEENGDRNLQCRIDHKKLLQARILHHKPDRNR